MVSDYLSHCTYRVPDSRTGSTTVQILAFVPDSPRMSLEPVGPIRPSSITLTTIPPLGLGGATFSTQFNPSPDDETTLPVQAILRRALSLGINLIDTSPYYGNSEIILGKALRAVWADGWSRDGMFICTKVGRKKIDEFDYSPSAVRESVMRSLERLGLDELDVVYCHDVEFVTRGGGYWRCGGAIQITW